MEGMHEELKTERALNELHQSPRVLHAPLGRRMIIDKRRGKRRRRDGWTEREITERDLNNNKKTFRNQLLKRKIITDKEEEKMKR